MAGGHPGSRAPVCAAGAWRCQVWDAFVLGSEITAGWETGSNNLREGDRHCTVLR